MPASPATIRERHGVLLCALAAAGFASMAVLAKLAYGAGANVLTLLSVRFVIAAVALWLIAAHRGVARIADRRAALIALGLGLGLYSTESALFYTSLTYVGASLAELLLFSYPALVVLGAIVLRRESMSRRKLAALAIATTGISLVLAGGQAGALDPRGVGLALGAATLYATYVLSADAIGSRLHPLTFAALLCTGAAVSFTVAGAASGSLTLEMAPAAWGWAALIALGSTVVSITAFLGGVARLGPGRASILSALEPPLAVAGACLVFGEQLGTVQLLGAAFVVSAVLVLQLRAPRRKPSLPRPPRPRLPQPRRTRIAPMPPDLALASANHGAAAVPAHAPTAGAFALVAAGRHDVGV